MTLNWIATRAVWFMLGTVLGAIAWDAVRELAAELREWRRMNDNISRAGKENEKEG
jgi:hypothetical protein